MADRPLTIFLSAAEASGDEHAAGLIKALRQRLPNARFVGAAGHKMAEVGCEVLADLTTSAGMLMAPVVRLGYWTKKVRELQAAICEIRPDAHIPVDSPALNWHLAETAKECGSLVVYYISPQVWAWAPWRVKKLARLTDHVACILPFEQQYLRDRGVSATFVGNPVFDNLPPRPDPLPDLADAWMSGEWNVAMLPGSRSSEIGRHARALKTVAARIRRRWGRAKCTFVTRTAADAAAVRNACGGDCLPMVVGEDRYGVLARSHFAVCKSGTVTLEAAYFGVPLLIFYRTGILLRMLDALVGRNRSLVGTPSYSLVNILAGRRIVPEHMPWRGSANRLADAVLEVMDDMGYLYEARRRLLQLVEPLRVPPPRTASGNAADLVCDLLRKRGLI